MLTLTREELEKLLIRAFEEGFGGYRDLREDFIETLLQEVQIMNNEVELFKKDIKIVKDRSDNMYIGANWRMNMDVQYNPEILNQLYGVTSTVSALEIMIN